MTDQVGHWVWGNLLHKSRGAGWSVLGVTECPAGGSHRMAGKEIRTFVMVSCVQLSRPRHPQTCLLRVTLSSCEFQHRAYTWVRPCTPLCLTIQAEETSCPRYFTHIFYKIDSIACATQNPFPSEWCWLCISCSTLLRGSMSYMSSPDAVDFA